VGMVIVETVQDGLPVPDAGAAVALP